MTTKFSLPAILCDAVTRPPFRAQIAFDGNWMEAWRFGPDALPSEQALKQGLAGRETDVAVEFCFELTSGENFFFGQRRHGQKNDLESLEFVSRALACSAGSGWVNFPDFLRRLEAAMPESDRVGNDVLCRDLDNVEIGITDWWRRGDVVEIWNGRSFEVPGYDQLKDKLDAFPSLHKNNIKFACLEFNFRTPLHHWFGIEISKLEDGFNILQISKASSWLADCMPTLEVKA